MRTLPKILLVVLTVPLVAVLAVAGWIGWDLMAPFGPDGRLAIRAVRPLSAEEIPLALRSGNGSIAYRLTLDGPGLETLLDGGRHISFYAHRCGKAESRMTQLSAYLEDVPIGGGGRQYWEHPRSEDFHVVLMAPLDLVRGEAFRCGDFQYEEHIDGGFVLTNGIMTISNEVSLPPPLTAPGGDAAP